MAGSLRQSIKQGIIRAPGSDFFISRTITSSNITVAAKDFSSAATGRLYIYDVVFKTDATGLAGATNFQLTTTNAKGQTIVLAESVANLGANKTVSMQNPKSQTSLSASSAPTILEAGQKLQYNGTTGAGTGAGTIDIFVLFQRVDENAQIGVSAA